MDEAAKAAVVALRGILTGETTITGQFAIGIRKE